INIPLISISPFLTPPEQLHLERRTKIIEEEKMESSGDFSKIASKLWEADELRKKLMLKEKEHSDLEKRYKEMEASLKTEIEGLRVELVAAQDAVTVSSAKYATSKQQLLEASRKIEAFERKAKESEEEKEKKKGFGLFK
ncbi:MAG: hypothetical protein QME07_07550, partial [bacterium]|nr:hypothetical protein [bacterium]